MHIVLWMNADSLLCSCWMGNGKADGLEFSTLRDGYALYHSYSGGIHAAGSVICFVSRMNDILVL